MRHMRGFTLVLAAVAAIAVPTSGQTSSIGAQQRQAGASQLPARLPREAPRPQVNPVYQEFSWISLEPSKPRVYRVGDLLTVIVRQRRRFQRLHSDSVT